MSSRVPPLVLKIGTSVVTLLMMGAVLEGGLRIADYLKAGQTLEEAIDNDHSVNPGAKARLVDMIRREPSRKLMYSLRPNLSVTFLNQHVETNREGFHDKDYTRDKAPGVRRIVGVGDSIMFGWGVPSEANYLSVLERRLNELYRERSWEVLNTAVPGYNTVTEVESLKVKGLKYAPDLVILGFCNNDYELPNFVWQPRDYLRLDRLFLVDFVTQHLNTEGMDSGSEAARDRLIRAPTLFVSRIRKVDLSRVPEPYRDMVGWASFETATHELHRLSVEHGFEVLGVFFGMGNAKPKTLAMDLMRTLDFHVVDMREPLIRHMEANGIEEYYYSELTLAHGDPHPSVISHELCAEALLEYIGSGRTRLR